MAKSRNYTDEDFIKAVEESSSLRQVLQKLNLKEAGGNYQCAKDRIKNLNLDTSHFHGMAWNKGKQLPPKLPIENYLVEGKLVQSHKLKMRLIAEGLKEHKCECCGITEWNGNPSPIELDHIDGNRYNNTISNLRILCPNCHAQTETYRGKNKYSREI
jgi:Zn finger protein HypA/HybF involved in hydrogenase expression